MTAGCFVVASFALNQARSDMRSLQVAHTPEVYPADHTVYVTSTVSLLVAVLDGRVRELVSVLNFRPVISPFLYRPTTVWKTIAKERFFYWSETDVTRQKHLSIFKLKREYFLIKIAKIYLKISWTYFDILRIIDEVYQQTVFYFLYWWLDVVGHVSFSSCTCFFWWNFRQGCQWRESRFSVNCKLI